MSSLLVVVVIFVLARLIALVFPDTLCIDIYRINLPLVVTCKFYLINLVPGGDYSFIAFTIAIVLRNLELYTGLNLSMRIR
jgi:hypothetical protein